MSVLLVPSVAAGQVDVGQTVGDAVGEVGKAVPQVVPTPPAQLPAVPVQPAPVQPVQRQAPQPSTPAAQAPSGEGSATAGSPAASGRRASDSRAGGSAKGGSAKASASSKRGGGASDGKVLAARRRGSPADTDSLAPADGQSFSGAVTTNPNTGVEGDPELPFTGLQVLMLLGMGSLALVAGLGLRSATRRRHAG
jgi:hypothetical protein